MSREHTSFRGGGVASPEGNPAPVMPPSDRLSGHDDDVGRAVAQTVAGFAIAGSAAGEVPHVGVASVGACQPRLHALVPGQVLAAAEVQAGQPTHHHARHGVSRQGSGDPGNPGAVGVRDRSMGAHRRQEHHPRARGLVAVRRQGGARPRQRHQHLPRHRAGGLGVDGRLVLRVRLRPQDGRHQHADQGPGHRQEPGADRAGHLGRGQGHDFARHDRGPRVRARLAFCGQGLTSRTTRSRSAPRRRW